MPSWAPNKILSRRNVVPNDMHTTDNNNNNKEDDKFNPNATLQGPPLSRRRRSSIPPVVSSSGRGRADDIMAISRRRSITPPPSMGRTHHCFLGQKELMTPPSSPPPPPKSKSSNNNKKSSISRSQHIPSTTPNNAVMTRFLSCPNQITSSTSATKNKTTEDSHAVVQDMKKALIHKKHLLDVTLVGRGVGGENRVEVGASSFVLSCRCVGLEKKLDGKEDNVVMMGDYSELSLAALVEFCFTNEMSLGRYASPTEDTSRALVELASMALEYDFHSLYDECYQRIRRLMNQNPPLAVAVYDHVVRHKVSEFETYALQTIEECWDTTLLGKDSTKSGQKAGAGYLTPARLEQLLDNDSFKLNTTNHNDIFNLVRTWMEHTDQDSKHSIAKDILDKRIQLINIPTEELYTTVQSSNLYTPTQIESAVASQVLKRRHSSLSRLRMSFSSLSDGSMNHVNRVIVKGAGIPHMNGIYYQDEDDETYFIKPGAHLSDLNNSSSSDAGAGGGGGSGVVFSNTNNDEDMGLHFWRNAWHIAPAIDLSNSAYIGYSGSNEVPKMGWMTGPSGEHPPPTCEFVQADLSIVGSKSMENDSSLPACFMCEQDLYGN